VYLTSAGLLEFCRVCTREHNRIQYQINGPHVERNTKIIDSVTRGGVALRENNVFETVCARVINTYTSIWLGATAGAYLNSTKDDDDGNNRQRFLRSTRGGRIVSSRNPVISTARSPVSSDLCHRYL